jgi:hypothetical protein
VNSELLGLFSVLIMIMRKALQYQKKSGAPVNHGSLIEHRQHHSPPDILVLYIQTCDSSKDSHAHDYSDAAGAAALRRALGQTCLL